MRKTSGNDVYVHGMDWVTGLNKFPLTNYRKYQYDLIGQYIGTDVLEVGSGDRSFTELIVANQPNLKKLFSIEPSETLFKAYKSRTFGSVATFGKEDLFALTPDRHGLFDTVVLVHVLEHVKEDAKALNHLHAMLKPGGRVLIEVPALPALFSVHDKILGHYRRYNKKNFSAIVDPKIYKIHRLWYQDLFGVFGSLVYFKILKIKLNSTKGLNLVEKQGGFYDNILIPLSKRIEAWVTLPFGLSLTGILLKK